MEIENNQDAWDKLADAIWWLKGFRAARDPEHDNDSLNEMIAGLQNVQYYLRAEKESK